MELDTLRGYDNELVDNNRRRVGDNYEQGAMDKRGHIEMRSHTVKAHTPHAMQDLETNSLQI